MKSTCYLLAQTLPDWVPRMMLRLCEEYPVLWNCQACGNYNEYQWTREEDWRCGHWTYSKLLLVSLPSDFHCCYAFSIWSCHTENKAILYSSLSWLWIIIDNVFNVHFRFIGSKKAIIKKTILKADGPADLLAAIAKKQQTGLPILNTSVNYDFHA
jgi:hypothetical protein